RQPDHADGRFAGQRLVSQPDDPPLHPAGAGDGLLTGDREDRPVIAPPTAPTGNNPDANKTYVGRAMPMRDALERVSGTLPLTLNHSLPGMAHAKVLRSPYPHALVQKVDASEAEALPGVITVLTGADLGPESGLNPYY